MDFQEELERVEFGKKIAVGGGGNRLACESLGVGLFEMPRCEDAKRHSRLRKARQLRSGAAKRKCHCEAKNLKGIIEIFENPLSQSHSIKRVLVNLSSLTNCKISSLLGRESGCCNQYNYNHERGIGRHKDTARATECAMTNVGENLLKTSVGWACHPNNETNYVQMAEIWMNDVPSPAFVAFAEAH